MAAYDDGFRSRAVKIAGIKTKPPSEFTADYTRHQSQVDFREDVLRNDQTPDNEQTFTNWIFPPSDIAPPKASPEEYVRWGTDSASGLLDPSAFEWGWMDNGSWLTGTFFLGPQSLEDPWYKGFFSPGHISRCTSPVGSSGHESHSYPAPNSPCASPGRTYSTSPAPVWNKNSPAETGLSKKQGKLTLAQKRRNHSHIEKRRRALVKDGFDDIMELIPELQGGGLSRAALLTRAADWLADFLQGNQVLLAQLRTLENEQMTRGQVAEGSAVKTQYPMAGHVR